MNLVCQFLDSSSGTFIAVAPERLQIRQTEPGNCALGALLDQPKKDEQGNAIVGETVQVFIPLINYKMDIVKPAETEAAPKIELVTEMPKPKKQRKPRVQ
jgi:hypothetical protein